jgi:hypothetical protein
MSVKCKILNKLKEEAILIDHPCCDTLPVQEGVLSYILFGGAHLECLVSPFLEGV